MLLGTVRKALKTHISGCIYSQETVVAPTEDQVILVDLFRDHAVGPMLPKTPRAHAIHKISQGNAFKKRESI